MKCLVPPDIQKLADEAEKRKDDTIDRLSRLVDREAPAGDPFDRAMRELIDADKKVIDLMKRKIR